MSTFTVTTDCGTSSDFETVRDAEAGKETHQMLCKECDEGDIHIQAASGQSTLDPEAGDARTREESTGDGPDTEEPADDAPPVPEPAGGEQNAVSLPDSMPKTVQTDPLDVVPEYMVDEVEGQPTINKRGYAVIANHFDIVVNAEPITTAGESDHEYAEFRATAWRRGDDPEQAYTGHGTARASEDRRGMADNLNEMAETRAMKRAVAWASGVGILAWEEMAGYLDEEA